MRPTSATSLLLGICLASASCSALGFQFLRALGLNVRLRPVTELDGSGQTVRPEPVGTPSSERAFLGMLDRAGFAPGSVRDVDSAIRLQVWLGNQVSKIDVHSGSARGYELLQYGMHGGGLACGAMSDIYREALVLLGVPARTVELSQSDFRQRTHAVVEALLEGRWRVLDPTFNVTYEGEGGALGVAAIQQAFESAGPDSVHIVWHGPRRYPADFPGHARNWRLYFANAYVYELGVTPALWKRLPPWRYWIGAARYYYGDHVMAFPLIQDRAYFMVSVVLPMVSLAAMVIACLVEGWIVVHERRSRRPAAASLPHWM